MYTSAIALKAIKYCTAEWPLRVDDPHAPTKNEADEYECAEGWYLYFGMTEEYEHYTTCVESAAECSGLYVSEDKKACLRKETDCQTLANEYSLTDGDTHLCVTAEECNGRDRFTF